MLTAMVRQARAAETRRDILAAAVELFAEHGYGGTNLNQIIRRARVTQGAFYYHFASKDEVAFAIIDEVAEGTAALRTAFLGTPHAGLGKVIEMTFQLGRLLAENRSYWVAAYLEHTMARHSQTGSQDAAERIEAFVADVAAALRPGEIRDGLAVEDAARTMVSVIYGALWMGGLLNRADPSGNVGTQLIDTWHVILPGVVAPAQLADVEGVLTATAHRYRRRPKQTTDLFSVQGLQSGA